MAEPQSNAEVAAAIRELAKQVDSLGNAVVAAADRIATAINKGINVNLGKRPGEW
jgi:hypothetical protein